MYLSTYINIVPLYSIATDARQYRVIDPDRRNSSHSNGVKCCLSAHMN